MNKKFLLFSLLAIFSFQVFGQTPVPEEQRSLLFKVSATWCPPCGGWAWDTFEELVEDNHENAIVIVTHYSGDLVNTAADEIAANVSAAFQPSFYLNNEPQGITSNNASSKRTIIKDAIIAHSQEMPVANMAIDVTYHQDSQQSQIVTHTKFFQDVTGEYYIASYLVEDEVINQQAGQGANAVHQKILRTATSAETFGELIVDGSISAGTEFEHDNIFTVDDEWDYDNMDFISIIWKKENDKFIFVNANIQTEWEYTVSADEVNELVSAMNIQPTVASVATTVSIDLEKELQSATLELYDFSGKKVIEIFQGNIEVGNSTFAIEKSAGMTSGMYLVVLQTEQGPITRKVIFE